MRLSRREVERYRATLMRCRADAAEYVRRRIMSECAGLGVAEARDEAIAIVMDAVDAFGSRAQAAACDCFDEMAEALGETSRATVRDGLTDPERVERKVRWFARRLVDGDLAGFAQDCADRAGWLVWREANMCTALNCEDGGTP